jgi:ribosomal protein L7Ae-like RNA K-turn-binding protein
MAKRLKKNDPADPEAVWRLLGLATKAGRAVSGQQAAENALRKKEAFLVLVTADSSENTRRKYIPPDRPPVIPVRIFGSKAEMGKWTGHDERSVAAIIDRGFAERMLELIEAIRNANQVDESEND